MNLSGYKNISNWASRRVSFGQLAIQELRHSRRQGFWASSGFMGKPWHARCAVVKKERASVAYVFANNEPITLLNGAELLGLLKKHGYTFRINLQEARRSV